MSVKKIIRKVVPQSVINVKHYAGAVAYNTAYGFPARDMKVIGVTGTNGKTTTAFLIHQMLTEAGYKTGLMTTAAWGIGKDIKPQREHMTNVPVPLLMKRLKQMKANGVEYLVLETTSMALHQRRTWGVPYSIAVLTNISQDHLDYHKTMANYVAAKKKLFTLVKRNRQGLQLGIVNADDAYGTEFGAITPNTVAYGVKGGDIRAGGIKYHPDGSVYEVNAPDTTYNVTSHLPGAFNVYNTLAAICVARAVGLTPRQIEKGIDATKGVPGRMQPVNEGQKFAVLVDYAHTPDALENVLMAAKKITKGKLAIVFGATGDRDKGKRGPMGEVAARLADRIYLTDDETYTENPDAIREAVMGGIVVAGGKAKTQTIPDRLEAIKAAFAEAHPGDTVLLAGLGHQDYRAMGGQKQPWDEREVASKLLKKLNN